MNRLLGCLALVLTVVSCTKSGSRGAPGTERGDCRAKLGDKDTGCNPGLLCLSNLCVAPPPADCTAVADQLASMDLGNYAEPDERAPVVAKYKTACETARVSKEEGECLDKATDKWSAGQCVPRMFPETASTGKADCKNVADKVRSAMAGKVSGIEGNPKMQQWFETTIQIIQQSCEEDAWPDALKKCILAAPTTGGVDAMQTCNGQMPPALQTKVQERLATAMRSMPQ